MCIFYKYHQLSVLSDTKKVLPVIRGGSKCHWYYASSKKRFPANRYPVRYLCQLLISASGSFYLKEKGTTPAARLLSQARFAEIHCQYFFYLKEKECGGSSIKGI